MFIERSESRVRLARTAFLLVCLVPCAALVAWAAYWRSDVHRDVAAASWARQIGLEVRCERVAHVRPGCVRLSNCVIRCDDGTTAAGFDVVEVETTPGEVRVRLPVFHATAEACGVIGRMAKSWLAEPSRHPRAWLVEVEGVRWPESGGADGRGRPRGPEGDRELDAGFRVECVAAGAERAVRIRREPSTNDEVRVVWSADGDQRRSTIEARVDEPVPAACVVAAIGWPAEAITGWCAGSIDAEWAGGGWSGDVAGSLDRFDAEAVARFFGSPMRLEGPARLDLASADFAGGRLARANATISIGPAVVSQELLERLVQVAQCRPGEAYRGGDSGLSSLGVRSVDRIACAFSINAAGVMIRTLETGAEGIVTAAGRVVLEPPQEAVAAERIPWAFAPRDARPLPATTATAWLVPLLPPSPPSDRR